MPGDRRTVAEQREREALLDREFEEANRRSDAARAPAASMALSRWNDDRLDDLNLRVRDMTSVVERVAPLAERVNGLSDDLKDTKDAVNGLRRDLRGMMGNPFKEARERKTAIVVGIIAAISGGVITGLITALSGGFGH